MLDFRTCPETRDYGGREEIVLSAVVCGALEVLAPRSGDRRQGVINQKNGCWI